LPFLEQSLLGDLRRASEELGATVPAGWPDAPDILRLRRAQLETDPEWARWLLRGMCHRTSGIMVGHIGFHGPPAPASLDAYLPGGIELGFTVFETHRRQGYAREATVGLMRWAHQSQGVSNFVVSISPGNIASQRLARSLGFTRIGSHLDEVDGEEDVLAVDLEREARRHDVDA
jgi:ribosomal-protein-alanine N-acetyltransferase